MNVLHVSDEHYRFPPFPCPFHWLQLTHTNAVRFCIAGISVEHFPAEFVFEIVPKRRREGDGHLNVADSILQQPVERERHVRDRRLDRSAPAAAERAADDAVAPVPALPRRLRWSGLADAASAQSPDQRTSAGVEHLHAAAVRRAQTGEEHQRHRDRVRDARLSTGCVFIFFFRRLIYVSRLS